jgi:hypothetical protein
LSETWHDADSVCVRRLRASGYQVVDRPRPRPSSEVGTMGSNHGGVLVAAVPGICLSSVTSATVAITAVSSFEAVCGRMSTGSFNCVVLAIYRPGSEEVTASFLMNWQTFLAVSLLCVSRSSSLATSTFAWTGRMTRTPVICLTFSTVTDSWSMLLVNQHLTLAARSTSCGFAFRLR